MPDYDYYLVDCSASDVFCIVEARLLKSEDVCGWLNDKFRLYVLGVEMLYHACIQCLSTKGHFYDCMVKCYPIADDGSIVQDNSIMRDIWLSCEVQDD